MKRLSIAAVVAVVVIASVLLAGCGPSRISGREFVRLVETRPTSMHNVYYVGNTASRAYLEEWSLRPVLGTKHSICWTPLSELPTDVIAKIRAGTPPWRSPETVHLNR